MQLRSTFGWQLPTECQVKFLLLCCKMKKKEHLTREQRYQISALLQAGHKQKEIAEIIGKDKSVVCRELQRNRGKHGYHPALAHQMAEERKERFNRPRKFTDAVRKRIVADLSNEQYSPEQIAGLAKREGRPMVSHTRIYQFIREDKMNGGKLYTHLRHRLKHRKRPVGGASIIKDKVSIEKRPPVVDERSRVGDWEIDTIIGKDGKGAIVTLTERKTGFLLMEKLPEGKKKLQADFFFCHPYSSWERGLNEYTNGLIRQYIPKGESFDNYDELYIKNVQHKINRRPREKLGFDCPKRLFFASLQ